jgi:WD40 repeat protein
MANKHTVTRHRCHFDFVSCVALREERLISGSADGSLQLHRLAIERRNIGWKSLKTCTAHANQVAACAWIDDATVVSADFGEDVRLWDVETGVSTLLPVRATTIAHLERSRLLACASWANANCTLGEVRCHSTVGWERRCTLPLLAHGDREVYSIAWAGADTLVTGCGGAMVGVWDMHTARPIRRYQAGSRGGIHAVHVETVESPQRRELIFSGGADGYVRVFDLRQSDAILRWRLHSDIVSSLGSNGQWLVSGSEDGLLGMIHLPTLARAPRGLPARSVVHCVVADHSRVIAGCSDGSICAYDFNVDAAYVDWGSAFEMVLLNQSRREAEKRSRASESS